MSWRLGQAVLLLPLISFLGACDRSSSGDKGPRTNLLLITLDTTRADRLGCYGHAEARTPAVDSLAASGVRFERAFCQVPLTLPSHTSLLTGRYPASFGIHFNGGGVLGDDFTTLAELFKSHGYRTGAFVSAKVLSASFGLNQGFDRYDDQVGEAAEASAHTPERPADRVCDSAMAWLEEAPDAPFFGWVHFFDPHHPYAPPEKFRQELDDPYDGEIAFVDSQIRRLLDRLDAAGIRSKTLIVVVGDHGEAFHEHGETEHGLFIYRTTMHVPLIVSQPSRLPAGRVVTDDVSLVDIMPTIVALMGWPEVDGLAGANLLPVMDGAAADPRPVFGETVYPEVAFGWSSLRSYATREWKLIDAPRRELYDRIADADETKNVIEQHPEVAARLQAQLDAFAAGITQRTAESAALDEASMRALESLGYVGVTRSSFDPANSSRQDPKDMLDVYDGFMHARNLLKEQRYGEVTELLEPLAKRSPESDELRALLGEGYLQLRRFADAEREFRASLRTVPDHPRKLSLLGDALIGQGKVDEAVASYTKAAEGSIEFATAHNRLGAIHLRRNDIAQAHKHFARYLELEPESVSAMTNLANVLPHMGRSEEAVGLLRKALQRDPNFQPAHQFLWQALMMSRRPREALDALRTACRVMPDDFMLKRRLAGLLGTAPDMGTAAAREALDLARQCCERDGQLAENLDVLAIAYAANGDFDKAVKTAEEAIARAEQQGKPQLAGMIAPRMEAYRQGRRR